MLTYFLLKPESSHMLRQVGEVFTKTFSEVDPEDTPTIVEAFEVCMYGKKDIKNKKLVYLKTFVADNNFIDTAYPTLGLEEKAIATKTLLDKPVTLIVLNLDGLTESKLISLKGKIFTKSFPEGTGLRGALKHAHSELGLEEEGYLEKGQNFIHIPDNKHEVDLMINYCRSQQSKEGHVFMSRVEKG